jgi:hypothetical protein
MKIREKISMKLEFKKIEIKKIEIKKIEIKKIEIQKKLSIKILMFGNNLNKSKLKNK